MKMLQLLTGFAIAVTSTAAWRYWHVDGIFAGIIVIVGLVLACRAFDKCPPTT